MTEGLYTKPEVFISYSRTEPGARPAVGADAADVGRWLGRRVATDLLPVLEYELSQAHEVWRDAVRMAAGDELGFVLDAALLSCDGAVIEVHAEAAGFITVESTRPRQPPAEPPSTAS